MMRRLFVVICFFLIAVYALPAFSQFITKQEYRDMVPTKKVEEFDHILVLGINQPFSEGFNRWSPLFFYSWNGDNFKNNKDLYLNFTMTTTRIIFIAAMKTDRVFTGIMPRLQHSTYAAWRAYNHGYNDLARQIGGNDFGVNIFFQYNWLRILSTRFYVVPTYHWFRMVVLTENEDKYVQMPNRHWQIKPGVEFLLSDVEEKSLTRVKHGYLFRAEYQYAHRFGYGTWYDYDRLWCKEKLNGVYMPWYPQGVVYKSQVADTHRLYFNVGGYYNFKYDINILFDYYGGYFYNVDRNNAEQIGYMQADHAIMPGYAASEFYHNFYMIARLQIGFPLMFWDARIQPGFNVLYMPTTNDVVGQGGGVYYLGPAALQAYNMLAIHGYPKRFYTSVSCSFSLRLGNLLPLFIDYAYGIDADRASASYKVYLNDIKHGCHELNVMVVMAFGGRNEKKKEEEKSEQKPEKKK